jgi:hypothetical protein
MSACYGIPKSVNAEQWDRTIRLIDNWARDPEKYRDEGVEPPSTQALLQAKGLALCMRKGDFLFPLTTCLTGEGGVRLEWRFGADENLTAYLELTGGDAELSLFSGCTFMQRWQIRGSTLRVLVRPSRYE